MATNLEFIKQVTGNTVANFDLTNIFSDKYNVYRIQIFDEEVGNDDYNYFRVIRSAGTDTGSNYCYATLLMYGHTTFVQSESTSTTTMNYIGYLYPAGYDDGAGITIDVYNPFDSSSYTFFNTQTSAFANGVGVYTSKGIMAHKATEQVTGISIQRTGNFNKVTANIYGVK